MKFQDILFAWRANDKVYQVNFSHPDNISFFLKLKDADINKQQSFQTSDILSDSFHDETLYTDTPDQCYSVPKYFFEAKIAANSDKWLTAHYN